MPIPNTHPLDLYRFITSDFEGAWNAVAAALPAARGNMMFAREAMLLLEWSARYCASRAIAHAQLSNALFQIEPGYFTVLPGPCGDNRDFTLPSAPFHRPPQAQLLWALFDLVRNGLGHQGQQILARLPDRRLFGVVISGVEAPLGAVRRQPSHLNFARTPFGHTFIHLAPDTLYLDIRDAIIGSGLLERRYLQFSYLERGGTKAAARRPRRPSMTFYQFSAKQLRDALAKGGHVDLSHVGPSR